MTPIRYKNQLVSVPKNRPRVLSMLLVPYLLKPVPTAETMTAKPTRKEALMGNGNLTADEKKARQAKHRLEEAEARNRVKERKARL